MRTLIKCGEEIQYGGIFASYGLSNSGGIALYEYDGDEIVIAGFNTDKPRGYRLYYLVSGRAYFKWGRLRIFLDECMRNFGKPEITHELKTVQPFFGDVVSGSKTFEVRLNDRGFELNDTLVLKEYNPEIFLYTGQEVRARVSYILPGGKHGIRKGYIVMGFVLL